MKDATSIVDVLRWRALNEPDLLGYTFLSDGDRTEIHLTYGELDRRARQVSKLIHANDAAEQPVLLMFPSGIDFIAAFFGCLYAGSIAVMVYPPRPNRSMERFGVIASDSGAKLILTQESIRARIEESAAGLKDCAGLRWISIDNIDDDAIGDWEPPIIDGQSLALLQYTSGSTAQPKGTMISHSNILHNSRMICEAFQHTRSTVAVGWLPMTHDMGLIGYLIQPLYVGFRCVLMSPEHFLVKPVRWLRAISNYRAVTSGGPDFAYNYCAQKIRPELIGDLDLSSWKLAFTGAENIRPDTVNSFSNAFAQCGFKRDYFYPCYGLAESTLMVTGGSMNDEPTETLFNKKALAEKQAIIEPKMSENARAIIGCGRPRLDQIVLIVDPESQTQISDSQIGEIWISGPSVAQGYWRQPKMTQQLFHGVLHGSDASTFLRSGDLGFCHNGELFISGRIKDTIIVGGANHFPVDIELTIEKCHPLMRPNCVAAFSVESDGLEKLVIVAEVDRSFRRKGDESMISKDITTSIREAVSRSHDLSAQEICLIMQSTIPKTSSGKIQRHVCKSQYLAGELSLA